MVEPLLSLAISVQSNPGVYALLVGSGISRTAGIPTGWEIVLDLIRRLARARGASAEPDPAAWYRGVFEEEPDYSRLLDAVAKSPSERQQLLRAYFEPTTEEREQGLKLPTRAHQAIADLIRDGYIRVVLTTNFDRMLEKALENVGIVPDVIDTPDKIAGAMPLVHSACTVIKLHGDYLDTRIKNTPSELEKYPPKTNRLLDRVLDEYGLIVCGWSAEWDTALRAAVERCSSRRFSMYWASFGEPSGTARRLLDHRRGQVIQISGADGFFSDVKEKVVSLESLGAPHPVSAGVAAATAKRLLSESRFQIRLHDFATDETERVVSGMDLSLFPTDTPSDEEFIAQVNRYEALTEALCAIFVQGCFWGGEQHIRTWVQCLERLARIGTATVPGYDRLTKLRQYPALLCLYAGGIASLAAERYDVFNALLTSATILDYRDEKPVVQILYNHNVMDKRDGWALFGGVMKHTPVNDRLHAVLRDAFRGILPDESRYTRTFDEYEYMSSMIYADTNADENRGNWVPVGTFSWRDTDPQSGVAARIRNAIETRGSDWPPLKAGLFGGSPDCALTRLQTTEQHVAAVRIRYW